MRATAALRWLRTDEGGRLTGPPIGPRYMATAILTDDFDADHPPESHFSVVIDFEEGQASSDESRPAAVSTLVLTRSESSSPTSATGFSSWRGPRRSPREKSSRSTRAIGSPGPASS